MSFSQILALKIKYIFTTQTYQEDTQLRLSNVIISFLLIVIDKNSFLLVEALRYVSQSLTHLI